MTKSLSLERSDIVQLGDILGTDNEIFFVISEGREYGNTFPFLIQQTLSVQWATIDETKLGQLLIKIEIDERIVFGRRDAGNKDSSWCNGVRSIIVFCSNNVCRVGDIKNINLM